MMARFGVLAVLLGVSGVAVAQDAVPYDAFTLADRAIPLPGGDEGVYDDVEASVSGEGGCVLSIEGGVLVPGSSGPGGCAALWLTSRLEPVVVELYLGEESARLDLVPREPDGAGQALRFDTGASAVIAASAPPRGTRVAFATSEGFVAAALTGDRVGTPPVVLGGIARGEVTRAWYDGPDGYRSATVSKGGTAANTVHATTAAPGAGAAAGVDLFVCPPPDADRSAVNVICIDEQPGGALDVQLPNARHVLKPNRAFLVVVHHRADHVPTFQLSGARGIVVPGNRDTRGVAEATRGDEPEAPPVPYVVTRQSFAPRVGNDVTLSFGLIDLDKNTVASTVVEFIVEGTYSGAFHAGFAGLFGGAVDPSYAARTVGISGQDEVVALNRGGLDLEVIVGYSVYLDKGGRSALGCDRRPMCFGPYLGAGMLTMQEDRPKIAPFKSFYLGAHWEPAPNFSFAFTGVLRRVDRLADGTRLGSPVVGEVPTRQVVGLGAGVVVNLTPDFFKLATGQMVR